MHTRARIAGWAGVNVTGLTLAFSCGLLAVLLAPRLLPLWYCVLALPLFLLPCYFRAPALAAVVGATYASLVAGSLIDARWPVERHGEDVVVLGHIAALPEARGADWRFLYAPDTEARAAGLPHRVRVSWYRSDAALMAGDCWQFTLRMRSPRGSVSAGAFDYERWLFRERIGATAYVREAAPCSVSGGQGIHRIRDRLRQRIDARMPEHPAQGLALALLIGDRSRLSSEDWEIFRRTGTSHLIAISGLHVGLLAGFFHFAVRWLWSRSATLVSLLAAPRAGLLAGSIAALAYAALAGFAVPTQRALIMWVVLALALWSGRFARPWRLLAVAWLMVLLLDPLAVLGAGTWLSFAAVGAILWLIAGRSGKPVRWHAFGRLQFGLLIALAPLTLLFFDGASWLSAPVNALAIPLFGLMLPALMLSLALSLMLPELGTPLLLLVADGLNLFRDALAWVAQLGGWHARHVAWPAALMALLGSLLLLAPRGVPLHALGLIMWLPAIWTPNLGPREGFRLAVLDVGQGLAVVIQTARHTLLFDAGPAFQGGFDAGEAIVVPWLRRQGVSRIDRMVLSHLHLDHFGGMGAVREAFEIGDERATGRGPPCIAGERWIWDSVEFEFLHPEQPAHWSINNVSCVLRVRYAGRSALITGDIEAGAERHLLRRDAKALRAEVLVAPHHGSATSSTAAFVDAVSPKWVLYGAGWRNRYQHPRPEVVARYAALGAAQHYTGGEGTLLLEFGPNGWRLAGARAESAAIWRAPVERLAGADAPP
jgi:competence protein ComEC